MVLYQFYCRFEMDTRMAFWTSAVITKEGVMDNDSSLCTARLSRTGIEPATGEVVQLASPAVPLSDTMLSFIQSECSMADEAPYSTARWSPQGTRRER